jgi:dihydrofolate synthase / folylpolyglutamate synthase
LIKFIKLHIFEDFLNSLGRFRMKLGLERMNKGLGILRINPGEIPCVQIVGTNGKGSTACFLESLARSHGLKTGLYTSPHLVSLRERIRINNCFLPDDIWLDAANEVVGRCNGLDLTYFEVLTLMAALIFKGQKVDLAVMEAGIGGRHDATTAFHPAVNIFTPVGLDHTRILGNTLEEISLDKSMAMKTGPVVMARQDRAVLEVFKTRADETGADVFYVSDYFDFTGDGFRFRPMPEITLKIADIGLKGFYQVENAATALLAWNVFRQSPGCEMVSVRCKKGLKNAFWPGRLHFVRKSPLVIMDGAHNQQAMEALKTALEQMGIKPATIIFSCLEDKDPGRLIDIVRGMGADRVLIPDIKDNPRAMPKKELAGLFGPGARPLDDVVKYLSRITKKEAPVLVCGSLYLLGEIYAAFPKWMGHRMKLIK